LKIVTGKKATKTKRKARSNASQRVPGSQKGFRLRQTQQNWIDQTVLQKLNATKRKTTPKRTLNGYKGQKTIPLRGSQEEHHGLCLKLHRPHRICQEQKGKIFLRWSCQNTGLEGSKGSRIHYTGPSLRQGNSRGHLTKSAGIYFAGWPTAVKWVAGGGSKKKESLKPILKKKRGEKFLPVNLKRNEKSFGGGGIRKLFFSQILRGGILPSLKQKETTNKGGSKYGVSKPEAIH